MAAAVSGDIRPPQTKGDPLDSSTIIILVVIGIALVVALAVAALLVRRRNSSLKQRFGEEYDRTVDRTGDKGVAEDELERRVERREAIDVVELDDAARERYRVDWFEVQKGFVDQPRESVIAADELITDVMRVRGYPVEDFDRRTDDLSVDHPDVVKHYRRGHDIADRSRDGLASTDELREAVVDYRQLFERLVGAGEVAS